MTEDEARTKFCPFARIAHVSAPTGGNRHYGGVGAEENLCMITRCIASDCMAWRWRQEFTGTISNEDGGIAGLTIDTEIGYCGLAGKP